MTLSNQIRVTVDNVEYTVYRVKNDVYGNPRYVMSYLALDIPNYNVVSKYGFKKYRGKAFGGGIVFQSYNLDDSIKYMVEKVKEVNDK